MWKEAFSGWPRGLIMTIAAAGFLTPLARGQTVQLNSNPAFAGSSNGVEADFIITPDSKRVIYRAELTTDDSEDLYSASTTAANTQIQLSNTMAAGDFVQSFALSPDSGAVVFGRLIKAASRFDLMRASTTAAGTQMTLSEDVARNYFSKVLMTPDGSKVVFWGAKSVGIRRNLQHLRDDAGHALEDQFSVPAIRIDRHLGAGNHARRLSADLYRGVQYRGP